MIRGRKVSREKNSWLLQASKTIFLKEKSASISERVGAWSANCALRLVRLMLCTGRPEK